VFIAEEQVKIAWYSLRAMDWKHPCIVIA